MFKIIELVSSKYYFLPLFNVYSFEILICPPGPISVFLFFRQWSKICFARHLIVKEEISSQIITFIKKLIKNMFLKSTHAKLDVESINKVYNKFGQETISNCSLYTLFKNKAKGH